MTVNECTIEDCTREIHNQARGLCRSHYNKWWLDQGDNRERERARNRRYKRPANLDFVPRQTDVGYSQAHKRVSVIRGRSFQFKCSAGCGKRAGHWALIPGRGDRYALVRGMSMPYSLNVDDYTPMCVPCHKAMDLATGRDTGWDLVV